MTSTELRSALVSAFPPAPIDVDDVQPSASRWDGYEAQPALSELAGSSWAELPPDLIERHAALLIYASGALYRAVLPAYLLRIVEEEYTTSLPYSVLSQLAPKDSKFDQAIFEDRVGPMTDAQREVVRRAIAMVAEQRYLHELATDVIRSW